MKIAKKKIIIVPWNRHIIAVILILFIFIYAKPIYCKIVNGSFETDTGQFSTLGWRNRGGEPSKDVPPGGGNCSLELRSGCVWESCSQYIPEARSGDIYEIKCWAKIIPPYGGGSLSWSNKQWIKINISDTVWTYINLIDTLELTDEQDSIYFFLEGGGGISGTGGVGYDLVDLTKLGNITLISNKKQFSEEFKLDHNYPNPFNPSTTIKYVLPKSKHVTINVYNTLGQKIETLVDKRMPIGHHQVEFNGQNLPSGVYLYRIKTGEYIQTRKMLLVK